MSAFAWPLTVLFALGWVLAAVFGIGHVVRWLRQSNPTRTPVPRPGATAAAPAINPARAAPPPGPAPNRAEADMLDGIARARIAASPQAIDNSRRIADGLRLRLPHLDDTSLGLAVLDLVGYVNAALLGSPDPGWALRIISDAFSLSAEELTRLARNEIPR